MKRGGGLQNWHCPRPASAIARPRPEELLRWPALSAVDARCATDANAGQQRKYRMRVRVLNARGIARISLEGRSVIVAMCVGQLGSLLPHVVVPSILAGFLIPQWHLSGAQAGLLAGSGAAGYMLAVPVLATLTDRIDARNILMAGSALSALGTLLFGLFASGLWSGACFNAIAGVGFAGAYMPGLKALTDRLAPGDSSRAVTLYTSSFSFGVGLSFLVSQLVAEALGLASRIHRNGRRSDPDATGLLSAAAGQT